MPCYSCKTSGHTLILKNIYTSYSIFLTIWESFILTSDFRQDWMINCLENLLQSHQIQHWLSVRHHVVPTCSETMSTSPDSCQSCVVLIWHAHLCTAQQPFWLSSSECRGFAGCSVSALRLCSFWCFLHVALRVSLIGPSEWLGWGCCR